MSPAADSTLAHLQQTIGDLQRQLAELTAERDEFKAERDEALAQQAANAEVLGVINSSPGDLAPVFDAILEKARRLCGAEFGTLMVRDGALVRALAAHGVPDAFAEILKRGAEPGPGNPVARLIGGEPLLHISDLALFAAQIPDDPIARAAVELGGVRTVLFVPLRKDDALLGFIATYRQQVRPFTDKQITLLQNFAAQAVIAIENARLLRETREVLAQQTATAEVLGVINSSPGDLAPVFDAILEKAHALCGASLGSLVLWDDEQLRAVATRGYPREYDTIARQGFSPTPPFRRLSSGELFVHIHNLATPPAPDEEEHSTWHAAVETAGIRSALFVPLRKDAKVLGYISAQRQEVRPFSEKQIALLQNFAAQAVIAMENARLLNELQDRTHDLEESLEYQTATSDVLQVISRSTFDLQPVLDTMCKTAVRLCSADLGGLVTRDGEVFRIAASFAVSPEYNGILRRQTFTPGRGTVTGRALAERRTIHVPDLAADAELALPEAVAVGNMRTTLSVPLLREGEPIGAITMARQRVEPFTERQIELVRTFADQAVIAIENTRLITETREALEQQTATAEVLQVINSSPGDLAPVFDAILENAHTLCGAAIGALLTFDGESFGFLARKVPPDIAESASRPFKPGPQNRLKDLIRGEPLLHILDAREVLALAPEDPQLHATVEVAGMRTFLAVPLRKDDRLIGAITAARQEVRPFSDKEIALLQNFAAQAVIAMENARLLGELHQRTDEVAELNRGLEARVAEQVEELGRVGRLN